MTLVAAVAAHLWQSTLFAAAVGLATLALRRNHAAIRHALWMAASVKFLVPWAALIALGAQVSPRTPVTIVDTEIVIAMSDSTEPLPLPAQIVMRSSPRAWPLPPLTVVVPAWLCGTALIAAAWSRRWRRVAAIARTATTVEHGPELNALRRLEQQVGITRPIRLVESQASLEPGVFGLFRPLLVWPRAIGAQLDERQMVTILAHEVSHVRRRDNLLAAIHMVVEALFWFHPVVWWIGSRLVDERERACDEAVVRLGSEPAVYAETIIKACRAYLESPIACVAGVTGSNLGKRVERIMRGDATKAMTLWQRILVGALPAAALVAPFVVGVLDAPRLRAASRQTATDKAPQFEVASIKPNKSGVGKVMIQAQPGGRFTAENVTLRLLIRNAYQLQEVQVTGGPSWLDEERFDIVAKADGALGDPFQAEQHGQPSRGQLMLRALLAERFKLETHTGAKDLPIYALIAARKDGAPGPKMQPSRLACAVPEATAGGAGRGGPAPAVPMACGIRLLPGNLTGGGATMAQLANSLVAFTGRIVFDRTGLTGDFDFTLAWTPDQIPPGWDKKAAAMGLPPIDANGPSIFTAIQEQLGLKLEPQRGPVDVLVVDRAEHPIEN